MTTPEQPIDSEHSDAQAAHLAKSLHDAKLKSSRSDLPEEFVWVLTHPKVLRPPAEHHAKVLSPEDLKGAPSQLAVGILQSIVSGRLKMPDLMAKISAAMIKGHADKTKRRATKKKRSHTSAPEISRIKAMLKEVV